MSTILPAEPELTQASAFLPRPGVIAASVAVSVPETVVTNAEIGARLGVDDDWIARRTGIHSRRVADPDERLDTHATESRARRAGPRRHRPAGRRPGDRRHHHLR